MEFLTFEVEGLVEIRPRMIEDERGYFVELFREDIFAEHVSGVQFVQQNQSLSIKPGTVRGIHFQAHPAAQGKLVRCGAGKLLDVAVDLRHDSPTYGRSVSVTLTSDQNNLLWIPVGFGHGFCTLEPNTVINYWVTNYYSAEHDLGLAWNDPALGISWPDVADPRTLSAKDRRQPGIADLHPLFSMKDLQCA